MEQKIRWSSGTKISGIKIVWDLWTLGIRDPPSLSTKRSERNKNEQNKNCVTQRNKNQWNKNWLGPLDFEWWGPPHFKCKKVRAEQKLGTGHQFLFCWAKKFLFHSDLFALSLGGPCYPVSKDSHQFFFC